jgi:hypothetical protein
MGPFAKPPAKATNGLLRKSLISVAEAVRTIFTPDFAAIFLSRIQELMTKTDFN